ncbi:MAG: hypothetical protein OXG15_02500 [Gammaproteobacteria bacterium]|nr:hypothetical protein [Gammaproteobacteria bacterium]
MRRLLITIPSHRRPHAVEQLPFDPDIWIVNDKRDKRDYRAAGASNVEIGGPGVSPNRNKAIEIALVEQSVSVQIDDDLRGIYRSWHDLSQHEHTTNTPIRDVAAEVWHFMKLVNTPIGGILASPNPYHSKQRVHTWAFIEGTFFVIDPRLPERFTWLTKEDWEMTCKVLSRVGYVVRLDYYVRDSDQLNQAGGLKEIRTFENESQHAQRLLREYPNLVRPHSTRPQVDVQIRATTRTIPPAARTAYQIANQHDSYSYSYP